jgi:hypothetical protein
MVLMNLLTMISASCLLICLSRLANVGGRLYIDIVHGICRLGENGETQGTAQEWELLLVANSDTSASSSSF